MPTSLPPFALRAPAFRFRHLAALAGRAPIGGAREVALACFVTSRLAADTAAGGLDAVAGALEARVLGARAWLGALTLPAPVREAAQRCLDASRETDDSAMSQALSQALSQLGESAAPVLDTGSRGEIAAVVLLLQRGASAG